MRSVMDSSNQLYVLREKPSCVGIVTDYTKTLRTHSIYNI